MSVQILAIPLLMACAAGLASPSEAHGATPAHPLTVAGVDGARVPIRAIVVPPSPPVPVRFAATELQAYLRRILSVDISIEEGNPSSGTIFVSTVELSPDALSGPLGESGFDKSRVAVKDGCVLVVGENGRSSIYAVYDFLQAALGTRFFGPGEEHEVIPRHEAFHFNGSFDLRTSSAFEFRDYYLPQPNNATTVDFLVKNRVNTYCLVAVLDEVPEAIRKRGGLVHGPGHILREFLPEEGLFAEHPEYFPLIEGKRQVTGKGACFSNAEVRRIFRERVRAFVRAHPHYDIFALWAEDTAYDAYCECTDCAKVSTGGWYMTLVNEAAPVVEQELPAALFEFIAYHETRWPPKEVMPLYRDGENMILNLCLGYSRNGFYTLASRKHGNAEVRDMYDAWNRRLKEVGFKGRRILFDYYNRCEISAGQGPAGQALIWPMDVIAEDTRFYLADGIGGLGDWVCFSRLCWPTPFNLWAWLRLYSAPDRSLEELEGEFYPAWFGSDGGAIRTHIRELKDAMYDTASEENIARIAALAGPLDERIAAQSDPVLKHRMAVVKNHLEYCLLLKRIWLAFMNNDEAGYTKLLPEYKDFYPVTHRELLANEIDIPSQFMNMWTEYHLKRPQEQIAEHLRGLVSLPSSR